MAHIDGMMSVSQKKKTVTVGGKTYPFPKGMTGKSVTTINNKSYVDGFELVDGEWKKTWKARWYKWF